MLYISMTIFLEVTHLKTLIIMLYNKVNFSIYLYLTDNYNVNLSITFYIFFYVYQFT
uniref:Uncharacterized protein n=1 Tax=Octopus bimaculoides TaxID=37653 RepID=A0A0L8IG51_OCTBM